MFYFVAFRKETDESSREHKIRNERVRKVNALLQKNREMRSLVKNVLSGDKLSKTPDLALQATKLLGDVETGSIEMGTKHNSLLGRWFSKKKEKEVEKKPKDNVMIERDRLVTCYADELSHDDEDAKTHAQKRRIFRALSVREKSHNKWHMTNEKQEWSTIMKEDNLKKYCCAVRMITDGTVEDYEDMDLITPNVEQKSACKIITGVDILCAHNQMFAY